MELEDAIRRLRIASATLEELVNSLDTVYQALEGAYDPSSDQALNLEAQVRTAAFLAVDEIRPLLPGLKTVGQPAVGHQSRNSKAEILSTSSAARATLGDTATLAAAVITRWHQRLDAAAAALDHSDDHIAADVQEVLVKQVSPLVAKLEEIGLAAGGQEPR